MPARPKLNESPSKQVRGRAAGGGSTRETIAHSNQDVPTGTWRCGTLWLSLVSAMLLVAAFPPWHIAPLAWIAPIGWLLLIRRPELRGRRPYLTMWFASFLFWLAYLHGLRLAHWALWFLWMLLAAYLAVYVPVFIAIARVALHRLRLPLMFVAPVVWTGLELVRGYLLTGFSGGLLGHTQVRWTTLIQVADAFGAYGVSFLVMFVAACLARLIPRESSIEQPRSGWTLWPIAPLGLAMAVCLGYGQYRLHESVAPTDLPTVRVALIQESVDTVLEAPPEANVDRFYMYRDLTLRTCREHPDIQVVIWPESAFTANTPELLIGGTVHPPDAWPYSADEYRDRVRSLSLTFRNKTEGLMAQLNEGQAMPTESNGPGIHLIAGSETVDLTSATPNNYNSAILVSPAGAVVDRYYKMHPVMFGEYIPLARTFPWLYRLTPMAGGLTPGEKPTAFRAAGWTWSPSVCFESTVPHLIRSQVRQLVREGTPPDVLVNVTNDGWFWGSSILDIHLHCAVFRAVENRRPVLIAANTGISAWIDGRGQILQESLRRQPAVILAQVTPDARGGLYQFWGDVPVWVCLGLTVIFAAANRWRRPQRGADSRE